MREKTDQPAIHDFYAQFSVGWFAMAKMDPQEFINALYSQHGESAAFRYHEAGVKVAESEVQQGEAALYAPIGEDGEPDRAGLFLAQAVPDEQARDSLNAVRDDEPTWCTWVTAETLWMDPARDNKTRQQIVDDMIRIQSDGEITGIDSPGGYFVHMAHQVFKARMRERRTRNQDSH